MTYNEAIDLLYNSLPVFQNIGPGAYKPGLDTSRFLDDLAGNPHRKYPTIHVAGTNGKGSTAHSLAAILAKAGYTVGLYTSPHIYDFRERIRVNGEKISEQAVVNFVERWINVRDRYPHLSPSFFELTSTMAFEYFAMKQVDIAVIETGLGGRLDSTNIITPVLSVITNISLDHTSLLGDTYEAIAKEKAGIIKPGVPVVIGEWRDDTAVVFRSVAEANKSEIIFARQIAGRVEADHNLYPGTQFGDVTGELRGECQLRNASTVFAAVGVLRNMLNIPDEAVRDGMADVTGLTGLFGRWSKIADAPFTVCDTGHNQGGWELLVNEIRSVKNPAKQLVIGFVADKDLRHILELIYTVKDEVSVWFSGPSCQRGLPAVALADKASVMGIEGRVVPDVNDAVRMAREEAGKDGFVLVAGSNFLIADLDKIVGIGE
ncbi:MAG: bifunctional folylpolyglutamate synthase/dihydrofolate synthase [Paenibacillus sp.]|nr:bifunctional folylpolyglutamate synthase/dihydrofolate synthase [Paenibacillus sp.]